MAPTRREFTHMVRPFGFVLSGLNALASLCVVVLMLFIAVDVLSRALFAAPIAGVVELAEMSIVAIVWMQFAYTLRSNQHLRSNLLFGRLPRGARRAIYFCNCLLGVAVFGMIAWFGFHNAVETYNSGVFEGEHPMRIPVWPVWAILTLGAGLMTLEYLRQAISTALGHHSPVIDELGTAPNVKEPN